jgi:protein-S-isoprenylcysteine O-methyltransferase Ste14
MYSSLLFLGWGSFFKAPSWMGCALVLVATANLVITAKVEEGENLRKFGDAYTQYLNETKMLVPFVF